MVARSLLLCFLCILTGFARTQSAPHAHPSGPPVRQTATLSDGTVVNLAGVTYGKERRFGGMSLEPRPGEGSVLPDNREAIILWIDGVRPATGPTARLALQPGAVRIYDETGKEFVSCEQAVSIHYLPYNRHAVLLYAWPRRGAEIIVEIPFSVDRLHPAFAKFRVRNPRVLQNPPFPSMAVPITRHDADLEVTLDGLHQMLTPMFWSGQEERLEQLMRGQKQHTMVGFRYRFRGQATTEWLPIDAVITDAAGNTYKSEAANLYQPPQYPLTYYRSDSDAPLKMGVWFQRTANADFAPPETCVMNDLPMRINTYLHMPGAQIQIDNLTLELASIRQVECVGIRTMITLNIYGADPHLSLLMQVRNERGKSANGIGPNEHSKWITGTTRMPNEFLEERIGDPRPHLSVDFLMDLPRGTSRITFTIAVNRAHYFEFTPTPTILQDLQVLGAGR